MSLIILYPSTTVHLFDWDEINFAEAAREMIVTGDYFKIMINYEPFWEKPPLFIWMQALSMHVFGINEFAARFPNMICGVVTLIVLFRTGREIFDHNFGLYWVLAYAGTFLPQLYFMSGIIDPFFNLFIFAGICYFCRYTSAASGETKKNAMLSGAFIGLAILTKGPVALLIFLLCFSVYAAIKKFRFAWRAKDAALFVIMLIIVSSPWYAVELYRNGLWFFQEFLDYQLRIAQTGEAGHHQPFYYHFFVLLFGCIPSSILIFGAWGKQEKDTGEQKHFKKWMLILFWVVFILFSSIKGKIIHYSSLTYFPITFLAAYYMYHVINKNVKWSKFINLLMIFIGTLFTLALSAVPFIMMNKEALFPYIKDEFAIACMNVNVSWTGFEILPGIVFFVVIIIFLFLVNNKQYKKAFLILFTGAMLATNLMVKVIVPKIEPYTQGPAIAFYKSIAGQDCYVETLGFKSYAHLFYTQKMPSENPKSQDKDWLLKGDIGKTTYFVAKINKADEWKKYPGVEEIRREGGFVFLRRVVE